ncbi:hypothetical protein EUGRSUZ_G01539 [Eucalyptus grandis]|uniref:Uncharacterized protein n=1 Tax=Eucalyptus grandis TaxID=71139 RepID=A0ACC3K2H9_EUCGR|nr:hypothetical protein EUGRSUZ_G01539 [Eucalyptus grandis]
MQGLRAIAIHTSETAENKAKRPKRLSLRDRGPSARRSMYVKLAHEPKRKLLNRLSGYAQTGRILAVMGPSGSGKSTFLDSLAGRISSDVRRGGNISLSGKKMKPIDHKDLSYVTQENLYLGTLTVKETIAYPAHLRLSSEMTKAEIDEVVETTIKEMGLEDCAENKIGNWHLRGISSGEKKRLNISLEMVTGPLILLLDEPTTGLDSASAFFVTRALRNIADEGRIVICSMHQPSSEVFDIFDDLLLLSSGETVFLGEAKMAIEFFADAGFACPRRKNPSDHFLRCISLDFDSVTATLLLSPRNCQNPASSGFSMKMKTAEIKATLIQSYKSSEYSCAVRRKMQEIAATKDYQVCQLNKNTNSSKWKELRILTHRSFINMYRDIGYSWLRIMFYVLSSISTGTLYFDIGYDNGAIINRGKCVSFIYGFMICLSCGGVPFLDEELKVLMMMASQIFRLLPDLPKFFWQYPKSYISFAKWAVEGQYKNVMTGCEFDSAEPGEPKLKGETILKTTFGISPDHSKWWDVTVLLFQLFVYKLLLFLMLRYKKRMAPRLNGNYS